MLPRLIGQITERHTARVAVAFLPVEEKPKITDTVERKELGNRVSEYCSQLQFIHSEPHANFYPLLIRALYKNSRAKNPTFHDNYAALMRARPALAVELLGTYLPELGRVQFDDAKTALQSGTVVADKKIVFLPAISALYDARTRAFATNGMMRIAQKLYANFVNSSASLNEFLGSFNDDLNTMEAAQREMCLLFRSSLEAQLRIYAAERNNQKFIQDLTNLSAPGTSAQPGIPAPDPWVPLATSIRSNGHWSLEIIKNQCQQVSQGNVNPFFEGLTDNSDKKDVLAAVINYLAVTNDSKILNVINSFSGLTRAAIASSPNLLKALSSENMLGIFLANTQASLLLRQKMISSEMADHLYGENRGDAWNNLLSSINDGIDFRKPFTAAPSFFSGYTSVVPADTDFNVEAWNQEITDDNKAPLPLDVFRKKQADYEFSKVFKKYEDDLGGVPKAKDYDSGEGFNRLQQKSSLSARWAVIRHNHPGWPINGLIIAPLLALGSYILSRPLGSKNGIAPPYDLNKQERDNNFSVWYNQKFGEDKTGYGARRAYLRYTNPGSSFAWLGAAASYLVGRNDGFSFTSTSSSPGASRGEFAGSRQLVDDAKRSENNEIVSGVIPIGKLSTSVRREELPVESQSPFGSTASTVVAFDADISKDLVFDEVLSAGEVAGILQSYKDAKKGDRTAKLVDILYSYTPSQIGQLMTAISSNSSSDDQLVRIQEQCDFMEHLNKAMERVDAKVERQMQYGSVEDIIVARGDVRAWVALKENVSTGILQLNSTLDATRQALIERGERLGNLGNKTADGVVAAREFAKIGKQLKEQQENQCTIM